MSCFPISRYKWALKQVRFIWSSLPCFIAQFFIIHMSITILVIRYSWKSSPCIHWSFRYASFQASFFILEISKYFDQLIFIRLYFNSSLCNCFLRCHNSSYLELKTSLLNFLSQDVKLSKPWFSTLDFQLANCIFQIRLLAPYLIQFFIQ